MMKTYSLIIAESPLLASVIASALQLHRTGENYKGSYEKHDFVLVSMYGPMTCLISPEQLIPQFNWEDPRTHQVIPGKRLLVPMRHNTDDGQRRFEVKMKEIGQLLASASAVIGAVNPNKSSLLHLNNLLDYLKWSGPIQIMWPATGLSKSELIKAFENQKPSEAYSDLLLTAKLEENRGYLCHILCGTYSFYAKKGQLGNLLGQGTGVESIVRLDQFSPYILGILSRAKKLAINESSNISYTLELTISTGVTNITAVYAPKMLGEDISETQRASNEHACIKLGDLEKLRGKILNSAMTIKNITPVNSQSLRTPPPTIMRIMEEFRDHDQSKILESLTELFDAGLITYPSNSIKYSPVMSHHEIESNLQKLHSKELSNSILSAQMNMNDESCDFSSFYGNNSNEISAIRPIESKKSKSLSALAESIYDFITHRYVNIHSEQTVKKEFRLDIRPNVEMSGYFNEDAPLFIAQNVDTKTVSTISIGDSLKVVKASISKQQTGPSNGLNTLDIITRFIDDVYLGNELNICFTDIISITNSINMLLQHGYIDHNVNSNIFEISDKGYQIFLSLPNSVKDKKFILDDEFILNSIASENTESSREIIDQHIKNTSEKMSHVITRINELLYDKSRINLNSNKFPVSSITKSNIITRCKCLGLPFPSISSESQALAWLNTNTFAISKAMRATIERIEQSCNLTAPNFSDDEFNEAMSFISKYFKKLNPTAPTEKLVKFSNKLEKITDSKIPDSFRSNPLLLHRYIKDSMSYLIEPVSETTKAQLKRMLVKASMKIDDSDYEMEYQAKKLISEIMNKSNKITEVKN